eukprot:13464672-Heterocapsa_arctica.AAC.1
MIRYVVHDGPAQGRKHGLIFVIPAPIMMILPRQGGGAMQQWPRTAGQGRACRSCFAWCAWCPSGPWCTMPGRALR